MVDIVSYYYPGFLFPETALKPLQIFEKVVHGHRFVKIPENFDIFFQENP